jgi:hypothetical protein
VSKGHADQGARMQRQAKKRIVDLAAKKLDLSKGAQVPSSVSATNPHLKLAIGLFFLA